jgi:hypothetical protein
MPGTSCFRVRNSSVTRCGGLVSHNTLRHQNAQGSPDHAVNRDVDIEVLDLNQRTIRPELQLRHIIGIGVLKSTDQVSRDYEAAIPDRNDFNGVTVSEVGDSLRTELSFRLSSTGVKGRRVLDVGNYRVLS